MAVTIILLAHAALVGWAATQHSPTMDETGNLAAGLVQLHTGRVDFSPHNPPLVRLVAALPVFFATHRMSWESVHKSPLTRPELALGGDFVSVNAPRSFWLFALARWACIPFSLLGGWICWRWSYQLYGVAAAYVALWLWCFSPNILAAAQSITPDMGASALGAAAFYVYWRWSRSPRWTSALAVGAVLGMAALAKATWLVLALLIPALWLVRCWVYRDWMNKHRARGEMIQVAAMLAVAVWIVNAGYGFAGTMKPLGDHVFYSETLSGKVVPRLTTREGGNRFSSSMLASVPVPLPETYLSGIDLQKREFELGYLSYLHGQWKHGGWWYYYLYALAVKTPLGVSMLFGMAVWKRSRAPLNRAGLLEEIALLGPAIGVLALVSSQTGYNHHVRYVLPVLPFAFIWISQVAKPRAPVHMLAIGLLLGWSTIASMRVYPQSAAFFNAAAGGPDFGPRHLLDSNIGSGQDLLRLKKWLDRHREASPLGLVISGNVDPRAAGIDFYLPPVGPMSQHESCSLPLAEVGPRPGWYAVEANFVYGMRRRVANGRGGWQSMPSVDCDYRYFQYFEPIAKAGYSIFIYHLEPAETNAVRQKLRMGQANRVAGGPAIAE